MNSLEKTFAEGRSVSTTMIYPTFVGIIGWIATLLSLIGYTLIGISLNSLSSDYTEYSAVQGWAILLIIGGILYVIVSTLGMLLGSIGFIMASGKLKNPSIIITPPQEEQEAQH